MAKYQWFHHELNKCKLTGDPQGEVVDQHILTGLAMMLDYTVQGLTLCKNLCNTHTFSLFGWCRCCGHLGVKLAGQERVNNH